MVTLGELVVDVAVTDDGARDQLGKQRHVGAEGHVIPLCVGVPSVEINGIGHDLEGVEGDAHGERQPLNGLQNRGQPGDQGKIFNKEELAISLFI